MGLIAANMTSEREIQIGARLRAFREMLQIQRTKFSAKIGCGSDQIAAYEAGRARLPYRVFKAIAESYQVSARWLAGDGGTPKIEGRFDDSNFAHQFPEHALFTAVYDAIPAFKKSSRRKYIKRPGLVAAAKALDCSLSHLHRVVISKERVSPSLTRRFEDWQAGQKKPTPV
jgi:transcriptional regulator with XRE-family HTH domain